MTVNELIAEAAQWFFSGAIHLIRLELAELTLGQAVFTFFTGSIVVGTIVETVEGPPNFRL